MIAIDTNVVIRLLTQDDADQYQKVCYLFNKNDVFITDSVILETEWVLRFAYNFDTQQIDAALTKLFGLPNVQLSHPALLAQVLAWHQQGLNFADAFHLANSQHCKKFFTFDKKMIKAAKAIDTFDVLSP